METNSMRRIANAQRKSLETEVSVTVDLDGNDKIEIKSGIGFFDHMLNLFAAHGRFSLEIYCIGDLDVDGHHSVEDIGIVLGRAMKEALGQRKGINRYGSTILPMDESLIMVSLDISGRPYLVLETPSLSQWVGDFDTQLLEEFYDPFPPTLDLLYISKYSMGEIPII